MARVKGQLKYSGSIQDTTFYSLPGSDAVFARMKGGPSKRRMKEGDEFALLRKHQKEWAACVLFSKTLDIFTFRMKKLGDYNVSPVWNGIGKKLINLDQTHVIGERWLELSKYPLALEGFNMNKNFQFNAVFKASIQFELNKSEQSITIKVPRFNSQNELFNLRKLPYFRLKFSIALFSDIYFNTETKDKPYKFFMERTAKMGDEIETSWLSTNDLIPANEYTLTVEQIVPEELKMHYTYLFCAGIEFAANGFAGLIEPVKNASAAKILLAESAISDSNQ